MRIATDNTYRQVQGLRRGLCILQALNDAGGIDVTPRLISERTTLNRTTVKRILETLAGDGYVRRNDVDGSYGLAPEVLKLSRALGESANLQDAQLLERATLVLDDIVEQTGWCVSLATRQDDCMVLRKTTQPRSNISNEPEMRKFHHLPMLFSALGRAYLSHCEDGEREGILLRLQTGHDAQVPIARNLRLVELITQRVRREGYAVQEGDWPGQDRFGAVAIPVRSPSGRTIASLSIAYLRQAVTHEKVVEEFVPRLMNSAVLLAAAA